MKNVSNINIEKNLETKMIKYYSKFIKWHYQNEQRNIFYNSINTKKELKNGKFKSNPVNGPSTKQGMR